MPLNVGGGVGLGLLLSFILCVLLCVRGSRAANPSAGARGLLLVCALYVLSLSSSSVSCVVGEDTALIGGGPEVVN